MTLEDKYIVTHPDAETIFKALADEVIQTIQTNNESDQPTVLILPIGPVGQYPHIIEAVNTSRISLKNTWVIIMDEYLDDQFDVITKDNPLSFRRIIDEQFYHLIDEELTVPFEQRIAPDSKDIGKVSEVIESLGGVDLAVGGIGLNGHIAFNEPNPEISSEAYLKLSTRIVRISDATRATNSINDLNGKINDFPYYAVTIGLKEVFNAKKIRLGVFRDWHKGVVKEFIENEPTAAFPVTILKDHTDFELLAIEHLVEKA